MLSLRPDWKNNLHKFYNSEKNVNKKLHQNCNTAKQTIRNYFISVDIEEVHHDEM